MTPTREAEQLGSELFIRYLLEEEEIMKTLSDRIRDIMRSYTCARCGAEPGQPCRTATCRCVYEHNDRYRQACEAGELPIDISEYYS